MKPRLPEKGLTFFQPPQPLPEQRRELTGPFDIIGDLHGCADELEALLRKLGYGPQGHPEKRRAIFLGDLTDRGPRNLDTYAIVSGMVKAAHALCVAGNHDARLLRYLRGKNVTPTHGLQLTAAELARKDDTYREAMAECLDSLVSHYILDGGRLVVAHAGLRESYHGRTGRRVRAFCLYGDTTGQSDEYGRPVRLDWAAQYHGKAYVVYGHTPVADPRWRNRTINIDTGCVFGGKLTALRYPELDLVQVPAQRVYCLSERPFETNLP